LFAASTMTPHYVIWGHPYQFVTPTCTNRVTV
jgi:hypothetical protein